MERKALDQGQATWLMYRKAQCASAGKIYEPGSATGLVVTTCYADLTKDRVKQLRNDFAGRLTPRPIPEPRSEAPVKKP